MGERMILYHHEKFCSIIDRLSNFHFDVWAHRHTSFNVLIKWFCRNDRTKWYHNCLTTEIFSALILNYREMTERPSRFLETISIQNSKYGLTMSQSKQNSFQKNSYKVVSVFASILKYFTFRIDSVCRMLQESKSAEIWLPLSCQCTYQLRIVAFGRQ